MRKCSLPCTLCANEIRNLYPANTDVCTTGSGCQLKDAAVRVCGAAVNACICICINACICACIYIYVYITYVFEYNCVRLYMYMYMYILTHTLTSSAVISMGVCIHTLLTHMHTRVDDMKAYRRICVHIFAFDTRRFRPTRT